LTQRIALPTLAHLRPLPGPRERSHRPLVNSVFVVHGAILADSIRVGPRSGEGGRGGSLILPAPLNDPRPIAQRDFCVGRNACDVRAANVR
jgi:hypothetical protein